MTDDPETPEQVWASQADAMYWWPEADPDKLARAQQALDARRASMQPKAEVPNEIRPIVTPPAVADWAAQHKALLDRARWLARVATAQRLIDKLRARGY